VSYYYSRYVGPYLSLSQDFAFIVEDEEGVCGYVLGALDSRTFYSQYTKEWVPTVKSKYPEVTKCKEEFNAEDVSKHILMWDLVSVLFCL
jgi:hypothetical protein